MNIKCPNCQTAYTVPDEKIGNKPRKMRCARCKEVFTVKRRSERTPYGYEEFTGKQKALPDEFAFLKQTKPPASPIEESESSEPSQEASKTSASPEIPGPTAESAVAEAVEPPLVSQKAEDSLDPGAAGPPPVPQSSAKSVEVGAGAPPPVPSPSLVAQSSEQDDNAEVGGFEYEDFGAESEEESPFSEKVFAAGHELEEDTNGTPSSAAQAQQETAVSSGEAMPEEVPVHDDTAQEAVANQAASQAATPDASHLGIDAQATVQAAPVQMMSTEKQVPTPAAGQQTQQRATGDIFGSSSWETEAPMELGGYVVSVPPPPSSSQKIGKIAGVSTGVVFLFLMFVLARNGWSLSASDFPAQVAFAFSGAAHEVLPKEVKEIEATVEDRRLIARGAKGALLMVTGQVFNNDVVGRSGIVLRGRLLDASGEIRNELRFTCDKVFDERTLKEVKSGSVSQLYQKNGKMRDCTISPESNSLYQLVFEGLPADYDESFEVEVQPVLAH